MPKPDAQSPDTTDTPRPIFRALAVATRPGAERATPVARVRTRRAPWLTSLVPSALIVIALAVWLGSLRAIHLRNMDDYGLISVLPYAMLAALALLNVSFCVTLNYWSDKTRLMYAHVLALVFMLYGITSLAEGQARFESSWRHAGITDYIIQNHAVNPRIDAYFNWPTAFIFNAFLTQVSGVGSALTFAEWAPLAFNLMYLGPLLLIMRAATTDKRVIWFGVWLFYLGNWIGQDYMSPQGLNYFFYLVIIALALRWMSTASWRLPLAARPLDWLQRRRIARRVLGDGGNAVDVEDRPLVFLTTAQRCGLFILLLAVTAVSASGHQLTPFFIVGALIVLWPFMRGQFSRLPILAGLVVVTWISYMANAYMIGHLGQLVSTAGEVNNTVGANVTGHLKGSAQHVEVVRLRLLISFVVWGLAFLGGVRCLRNRRLDARFVVLALLPFPFLPLQPYGGELLLRVYLFALPPMAYFMARLFFPTPARARTLLLTLGTAAVSIVLCLSFLVTRYGNERMDNFTAGEVAATHYLYTLTDPGSVVVVGSVNLPWKFEQYGEVRYAVLSADDTWKYRAPASITASDFAAFVKAHDPSGNDAYIVLTRSEDARATILGELQPGTIPQLEDVLSNSDLFTRIYANADAEIFVLSPKGQQ